MKLTVNPVLLKLLTVAAGGLGMVMHVLLFVSGMDEKGLLHFSHWTGRGLWILTVSMVAGLFLLTRIIRGPMHHQFAYHTAVLPCIGAAAAAIAFGHAAFVEFGTQSVGVTALTFASAVSLAVIAVCRLLRRKPHFLLYAVLCVFFAIRMVSQYRHWNSDPQLLDYVFYLGAYIALMLTAYQHAAFSVDLGDHRALWFWGLLAVFLCNISLTSDVDTWVLLGCGIWSFTNLTCLKVRLPEAPSQEEE